MDVEDVFYRAFQLAPLRLCWRTRDDLPDLKKCSKALRDAESRRPQLLLKRGAETRRLTVEGQKWLEDNFDRLAESLGDNKTIAAPRIRGHSRMIAQALRSKVFKKWKDEGAITEEKWQVAEMLRCSPDSSRTVFRNRLEALHSASYSSGRTDALAFFNAVHRLHSDWF